jgi:hypothetical protein
MRRKTTGFSKLGKQPTGGFSMPMQGNACNILFHANSMPSIIYRNFSPMPYRRMFTY